jgi:riboflavin synthase
MFTGIITDIGHLISIHQSGDWHLRIATAWMPETIDIGASIACSGVCLTVVNKGGADTGPWFDVDVSAETMTRTNLGKWQPGSLINLERALRVGEELGGHIVSGHVDGVGQIEAITPEGESRRFVLTASRDLAPYLVGKGSVALDGVSLTINSVADRADSVAFGVNIIPHTQKWTTFGQAEVGQPVNIEIDMLARYVARLKQLAASHT